MRQLDILMIAIFLTKFILTFTVLLVIAECLYINSILMLNIGKNELCSNLQFCVPLNWNILIECCMLVLFFPLEQFKVEMLSALQLLCFKLILFNVDVVWLQLVVLSVALLTISFLFSFSAPFLRAIYYVLSFLTSLLVSYVSPVMEWTAVLWFDGFQLSKVLKNDDTS